MVDEKLDINDPESKEIIAVNDNFVRKANFNETLLEKYFPKISSLWFAKRIASNKNMASQVKSLCQKFIESHLSTYDEDNMRDFVDAYINKIKETKDPKSSFFGDHGYKSLQIMMMDLFLAGTETTSSSILWNILFLIKYPEIQEKLHRELDIVFESTFRQIRWEDKGPVFLLYK